MRDFARILKGKMAKIQFIILFELASKIRFTTSIPQIKPTGDKEAN